jgi:hypothetical protein
MMTTAPDENLHIGEQLNRALIEASTLLSAKYTTAAEMTLPSGFVLAFRRITLEGHPYWGLVWKPPRDKHAADWRWTLIQEAKISVRCEALQALPALEHWLREAAAAREQEATDALAAFAKWKGTR